MAVSEVSESGLLASAAKRVCHLLSVSEACRASLERAKRPSRSFATFAVSETAAKTSALVGVQPTPHARRLVGADGILEASFLDRALGTDLLGSRSSRRVLGSREENVAGNAITGGVLSPINIRLPHNVCQSQQFPAFLSASLHNVHGASDNS